MYGICDAKCGQSLQSQLLGAEVQGRCIPRESHKPLSSPLKAGESLMSHQLAARASGNLVNENGRAARLHADIGKVSGGRQFDRADDGLQRGQRHRPLTRQIGQNQLVPRICVLRS